MGIFLNNPAVLVYFLKDPRVDLITGNSTFHLLHYTNAIQMCIAFNTHRDNNLMLPFNFSTLCTKNVSGLDKVI